MNKHQSKYFNTAVIFDEALISLLSKKDFEYITIKEICKLAGFNRSTFYLHYENMNDLLDETIEYITNKLIDSYNIEPKVFIEQINTSNQEELKLINEYYLKPFLIFVENNKQVFISAFRSSISIKYNQKHHNLNKYIINPILDKFKVNEIQKPYLMSFYLNGIMAIIKTWVLNNCDDDIDTIMEIILNCVKT